MDGRRDPYFWAHRGARLGREWGVVRSGSVDTGGWLRPRCSSPLERHNKAQTPLRKGNAMKRTWMKLAGVACLSLLAGAAHGQVVISQVYGAGGNTGAPYNADYVELFNKGASAVNLTGWTINYASATGSFGTNNRFTIPSGTIQPGGYFLVQLATGVNGAALPTPDATSPPT